ncbi:MAG: hypothetical protein FWG18_01405 [Alphaproteobacteria bacterium]|nr:hypothetical protein [Alphaproteobacteria bacterium]
MDPIIRIKNSRVGYETLQSDIVTLGRKIPRRFIFAHVKNSKTGEEFHRVSVIKPDGSKRRILEKSTKESKTLYEYEDIPFVVLTKTTRGAKDKLILVDLNICDIVAEYGCDLIDYDVKTKTFFIQKYCDSAKLLKNILYKFSADNPNDMEEIEVVKYRKSPSTITIMSDGKVIVPPELQSAAAEFSLAQIFETLEKNPVLAQQFTTLFNKLVQTTNAAPTPPQYDVQENPELMPYTNKKRNRGQRTKAYWLNLAKTEGEEKLRVAFTNQKYFKKITPEMIEAVKEIFKDDYDSENQKIKWGQKDAPASTKTKKETVQTPAKQSPDVLLTVPGGEFRLHRRKNGNDDLLLKHNEPQPYYFRNRETFKKSTQTMKDANDITVECDFNQYGAPYALFQKKNRNGNYVLSFVNTETGEILWWNKKKPSANLQWLEFDPTTKKLYAQIFYSQNTNISTVDNLYVFDLASGDAPTLMKSKDYKRGDNAIIFKTKDNAQDCGRMRHVENKGAHSLWIDGTMALSLSSERVKPLFQYKNFIVLRRKTKIRAEYWYYIYDMDRRENIITLKNEENTTRGTRQIWFDKATKKFIYSITYGRNNISSTSLFQQFDPESGKFSQINKKDMIMSSLVFINNLNTDIEISDKEFEPDSQIIQKIDNTPAAPEIKSSGGQQSDVQPIYIKKLVGRRGRKVGRGITRMDQDPAPTIYVIDPTKPQKEPKPKRKYTKLEKSELYIKYSQMTYAELRAEEDMHNKNQGRLALANQTPISEELEYWLDYRETHGDKKQKTGRNRNRTMGRLPRDVTAMDLKNLYQKFMFLMHPRCEMAEDKILTEAKKTLTEIHNRETEEEAKAKLEKREYNRRQFENPEVLKFIMNWKECDFKHIYVMPDGAPVKRKYLGKVKFDEKTWIALGPDAVVAAVKNRLRNKKNKAKVTPELTAACIHFFGDGYNPETHEITPDAIAKVCGKEPPAEVISQIKSEYIKSTKKDKGVDNRTKTEKAWLEEAASDDGKHMRQMFTQYKYKNCISKELLAAVIKFFGLKQDGGLYDPQEKRIAKGKRKSGGAAASDPALADKPAQTESIESFVETEFVDMTEPQEYPPPHLLSSHSAGSDTPLHKNTISDAVLPDPDLDKFINSRNAEPDIQPLPAPTAAPKTIKEIPVSWTVFDDRFSTVKIGKYTIFSKQENIFDVAPRISGKVLDIEYIDPVNNKQTHDVYQTKDYDENTGIKKYTTGNMGPIREVSEIKKGLELKYHNYRATNQILEHKQSDALKFVVNKITEARNLVISTPAAAAAEPTLVEYYMHAPNMISVWIGGKPFITKQEITVPELYMNDRALDIYYPSSVDDFHKIILPGMTESEPYAEFIPSNDFCISDVKKSTEYGGGLALRLEDRSVHYLLNKSREMERIGNRVFKLKQVFEIQK